MSIAQNYPIISPSLSLDFANVQALDPRITYARATTATYYGTRTALAEQNLLLQSQTFGNASWSKVGSTATEDTTTAPDGTTTADSFIPLATNGVHRAQQTTTGVGVFAFSVFVKANGYSKVGIWDSATTGAYAAFDLSTGTVLNSGAGASSATIIALTNSWYRISFVATMSGSIGFAIQVLDPAYTTGGINVAWLADGTSGIFIWGAQLEQRSSVTAYTPTTTQPITNYIPVLETAASNVARFDHNPTTFESLGLLIEEQRTNLVTYSEQFDNAAWTKVACTVSSNVIIAPDGTLTGDKIVENVSTGELNALGRSVANTVPETRTYSFFVKAAERRYFRVAYSSGQVTGNPMVIFDLQAGTVTQNTANLVGSIVGVGNGWYRASVTSATGTLLYFGPYPSAAGTFPGFYNGDGFSGIYIWGAQLEAGAFATSYIPTVASQVTRAADTASMTGTNFSNWYAQGEGTLYVESLTQNLNFSNSKNIILQDGTSSNQIWVGGGSPTTSARSQVILGGVTYFDSNLTNQTTAGQFGKYAVSFETNNAVLCANGTLGVVDTAVSIPSSINQLTISPPQRAGYYKKIAYYPVAVTSAQLQALTS